MSIDAMISQTIANEMNEPYSLTSTNTRAMLTSAIANHTDSAFNDALSACVNPTVDAYTLENTGGLLNEQVLTIGGVEISLGATIDVSKFYGEPTSLSRAASVADAIQDPGERMFFLLVCNLIKSAGGKL